MYGYIYKTTNLINQNVYIGQHKGEFDPTYFGSGVYIKRALKKYGIHSFRVELLTYAFTQDELIRLEIKFIADYRRLFPADNMYNISNGGKAFMSGLKHSEETKQKLRAHYTEERKIKIREWRSKYKGANHPLYGKHPSLETRAKIKEARKRQEFSIETRRRMSAAHKGKPHTEEWKKKIGLSQKGVPCPQRGRKKCLSAF